MPELHQPTWTSGYLRRQVRSAAWSTPTLIETGGLPIAERITAIADDSGLDLVGI